MSNNPHLERLEAEHRQLDAKLQKLESATPIDTTQIKTLKRKKLQLKDKITKLKQEPKT